MAIQMRRGNKADFDPSKMLPGEWAVAIDRDTQNQIVWMCFRAGVVKRMGTYEDFKEQIREATAEIKNEYKEEFQTILGEIEKLAERTSENRNTVVQIRDDTVNTYLPKMLEYVKKAESSATKAEASQQQTAESAIKAQSYAVGGTGSREGEDSDNAKYYYEQVKDVSEAVKGGLQPRGTVAFADLPQLADCVVGWMFNISDEFTTTDDFKEGAGNTVPAGANIYKTSDGKWDVLAGTPVTGIKGAKEDSFRRGNVEITAENVGAVAVGGDTAENTVTFNAASERKNLASGESHTTLFGKIAKWLADLKEVAFTGKIPWADVTGKPSSYPPSSHTHAYIPTTASCNKNWNWSGQSGQPSWLWGGNSSTDMYVYNPSNFTVWRCSGGIQKTDSDLGAGLSGDATIFRTYNNSGTTLDNKIQLGSGGSRFKQLFAATTTISTSDRNFKDNIEPLTDIHLNFFLKLQPVSFLFKNGDSGRTHVGFIAQDVEEAMKECGLTDLDFAGFCKDQKVKTYTDANGKEINEPVLDANGNPTYIYSLRYEEFIPLVTDATQKLWKRADAVEKENAEIKEQIRSMQQDIEELKKVRA